MIELGFIFILTSTTDVNNAEEPNRQVTLTYAFSYEIPTGQSPDAGARHSHIRSRRSMLSRATREHSAEVFRARKQVCQAIRSRIASPLSHEYKDTVNYNLPEINFGHDYYNCHYLG